MVTMTDLSKAADTLGYPAFIPCIKGKVLLHNQRLGRIYPKTGIKHFIFWLMRTTKYRQSILASMTGTTVKHTSPSKILEYKFSFCTNDKIANEFETIGNTVQRMTNYISIEANNLILLKDLLLSKMTTQN